MKKNILAVFAAFLAFPCACKAVEIVDQVNLTVPLPDDAHINTVMSSMYRIESTVSAAQVVTTGVKGKLTRVELGVWRGLDTVYPLTVDISTVVGGAPDFEIGSRLVSKTIDVASIPTTYPIHQPIFSLNVDVSDANLNFEVGQQFAIVLRSFTEPFENYSYKWRANTYPGLDTYSGGAIYTKIGFVSGGVNDAHFRTFVDAVEVPEPASLALAAVSLLLVARHSHR